MRRIGRGGASYPYSVEAEGSAAEVSGQDLPGAGPGTAFPIDDLQGAALAERLEAALWLYNFDAARIVWANRTALKLWQAEDAAALAARDMGAEMSASVRKRLAQHREDLARDPSRVIHEVWTLYPGDSPFRVRAALHAFDLAGAAGMLVEARPEDPSEPEMVRSADALLHTQVSVALCDGDGRFLYVNPAHRTVFGPEVADFADPFLSVAEAAGFRAALSREPEHRATACLRTMDGPRWHDIHAVRCRDAVTGDGAFLVSALDVTEAREHAHVLKEARDAAEAANRAKSAFLAVMSHELRTPLNGVLGFASLLTRSRLDNEQQQMLAGVSASGERMLMLIETILDAVSLDTMQLAICPAPFDPLVVLRGATEAFRREAEAKGLSLRSEAGAIGPGPFVHDAALIGKALRQFIDNAVKFSESGRVVTRVDAEGVDGLRYSVTDTGPGLDAAARAALFSRFQQLDGSITRRHGGMGLGLSISAELARLWGGAIGVESTPGAGATFWFTVPGAASSAARPRAMDA